MDRIKKNEKFWLGFRTVTVTAVHPDGRVWVKDSDGDCFIVRPSRLEKKTVVAPSKVKK